jgi:thiamine-monophosphate kinase
MRETDLIDRIRRLAGHSPLIRGIGDDCAILRPRLNEDLVFTSDFALEGRHFTLKTHTAADIGHLALARSLSDIAAMGAEPVFCMVSLAMPRNFAVQRFFKSLLTLAREYEMTLAGGDLSRFDKVVADVICCGRVPRGKAMLRSSAKPGDLIYVTGKLGKPRHRPQPRVAAGLTLRRLGVKAAMDLSDGLSLDLARLCRESNAGAELSFIPIARGVTLDQALHGGEDYELLFTASPKLKIPKSLATEIGRITRFRKILLDGRPLAPKGFDHFA